MNGSSTVSIKIKLGMKNAQHLSCKPECIQKIVDGIIFTTAATLEVLAVYFSDRAHPRGGLWHSRSRQTPATSCSTRSSPSPWAHPSRLPKRGCTSCLQRHRCQDWWGAVHDTGVIRLRFVSSTQFSELPPCWLPNCKISAAVISRRNAVIDFIQSERLSRRVCDTKHRGLEVILYAG